MIPLRPDPEIDVVAKDRSARSCHNHVGASLAGRVIVKYRDRVKSITSMTVIAIGNLIAIDVLILGFVRENFAVVAAGPRRF